jgi:hypothetical protein
VQYDNLFDVSKGCGDDILPYMLGDESYSIVNWIMTLFKEEEIHTILKKNYNRKDKCSWFVVENAFWIFKKLLLLCKFDLDVVFILDIFICVFCFRTC